MLNLGTGDLLPVSCGLCQRGCQSRNSLHFSHHCAQKHHQNLRSEILPCQGCQGNQRCRTRSHSHAENPDNLITSEMLQVLSSPGCPALLPAPSCLSALLSPQLCFLQPNDSLIPQALSHRS